MAGRRGFASDNTAGIHPEMLRAIAEANVGHCVSYGADPWTERAQAKLCAAFGEETESFFVFGGTATNVLGLKAITETYHLIICAETAHIHVDECGAPERFTGCKLLPLPSPDGKVTPEQFVQSLHGFGNEHHSQPRVLSITQATELGTVYTPAEMRALAEAAHAHGLLLHVDGARLANAAAYLGVGLREISTDVGVDVLSFGGAKNGLLFGEAIVFLNTRAPEGMKYLRKQGMQLIAKMRFVSAQFEALLNDDLWRRSAGHANDMAQYLAACLAGVPGVTITQPVQSNGVFAIVPAEHLETLRERVFFYVWDDARNEVRWMTSWDTTREDIDAFVATLREVLG